MASAKLNLIIEQGTTFEKSFTLKSESGDGIDLTGQTIRGQMREKADAANPPAAEFTVTILNQITNPGEFTISLTDSQTSALVIPNQIGPNRISKKYAYDIERVNLDLKVDRIVEGIISVSPEVTK